MAQLRLLADKTNVDGEQNLKAMVDVLARLVIRWDLTDHGVPVPVTREGIANVPVEIRTDVLAVIIKSARVEATIASDTVPASLAITARRAARASNRRC